MTDYDRDPAYPARTTADHAVVAPVPPATQAFPSRPVTAAPMPMPMRPGQAMAPQATTLAAAQPEAAASFFGPAIPRGILLGTVAAFLYGLLAYGLTALTDMELFPAVIALGMLIGVAVRVGAGRGGTAPACIAVAICVLGLLATQYFVRRYMYQIVGLELPLWPRFDEARQVVREAYDEQPLLFLWNGAAVIAAAVVAGSGGERRERVTVQAAAVPQPNIFGQALRGNDQPKEVRTHPRGGIIRVMSVLSVCCGPIFSIVTWVMANRALEEIRQSRNVTWINKQSIVSARKLAIRMIWVNIALALAMGVYITAAASP